MHVTAISLAFSSTRNAMKISAANVLLAFALFLAATDCKASLSQSMPLDKDNSGNNTWIPIGFNKERIASMWVQLKSYEALNENSFRMNIKYTTDEGSQISGRIDLNCKNKDFYVRPNGVLAQLAPWAAVPSGSGIYGLGQLYCKNTAAKADWGFTEGTSYLWDAAPPLGDPSNAKGDWKEAYIGDDTESYYNDAVTPNKNVITYAIYYRAKKGDRSAAQGADSATYQWLRNSCKENLASAFYKPDIAVEGEWMPPQPGRPGGANMITRKTYCK